MLQGKFYDFFSRFPVASEINLFRRAFPLKNGKSPGDEVVQRFESKSHKSGLLRNFVNVWLVTTVLLYPGLCCWLFVAKFESFCFWIIKDNSLIYIYLFFPLVLGLFSVTTSGHGAHYKRRTRINTDRFPKRVSKIQPSEGIQGHAQPGNFLDFKSLKSLYLGFWVIQDINQFHSLWMKP